MNSEIVMYDFPYEGVNYWIFSVNHQLNRSTLSPTKGYFGIRKTSSNTNAVLHKYNTAVGSTLSKSNLAPIQP